MSWKAQRFNKSSDGSRVKKIGRSLPGSLSRKGLGDVFHYKSLRYALAVCLRLQKMKGRGNKETHSTFKRVPYQGRNYHHMTPRNRHGELFYGTNAQNMLLIGIDRHNAWHKLFELQTLEETIKFLVACTAASSSERYFVMSLIIAYDFYHSRHLECRRRQRKC